MTARKLSAMVLCSVFAGLGIVASGCLGSTNQAPTAVAGSNATGGQAYVSQEITFNGSSSKDPDGTITKYEWDFGDNTGLGTGVEVKHVYATAGAYKVKLTVTDNGGATASATLDLTILAAGKDRTVMYRAYPPNHFVGQDLTFIACDSQDIASADELHWDWGDTTSDMVPYTGPADCIKTHKFSAKGSKSVKLEIHYKDAGKGSFASTVNIYEKLTTTNATTFVVSTISDPVTLDPAIMYDTASGTIVQDTYETLYFYDREKADAFVPVLATAMPTVSTDGMEYTIPVRKGVKFFSGAEMKASDVAFSLARVVAIGHHDGPSWMLEQVATAFVAQYHNRTVKNWTDDEDGWGAMPSQRLITATGKGPNDIITETEIWRVATAAFMAPDDSTFKIKLDRPYPAVVPILAFTIGSVTEEKVVRQICGFPIRVFQYCTDTPADGLDMFTPAGTGPYEVKKGGWDPGKSVTMDANLNWWQRTMWGNVQRLDKVVIRNDPILATRVQLLKNGDADTAAIGYTDQDQVKNDPNLKIDKDLATFVVNIVGMNQNLVNTTGMSIPKDFFADVNTRKGFAYAFNYQNYIDNCQFGGAEPGYGPIPKGMFGFSDVGPLRPTYDKAKAQSFFEKTPWWNKGFYIEVAYNTGNTARQCLANQFKTELEALNTAFHVNVTSYDWPTYLGKRRTGQLALAVIGWAPDYADPDDYAQPFMRSSGFFPRTFGYKNTAVDALVDDAAKETNATKRAQLYAAIQEAGFTDQPYIWSHQSLAFHVERTWVRGWFWNIMTLGASFSLMMKGNA
jgi:peptide/nickel transport system substrate-binding protein